MPGVFGMKSKHGLLSYGKMHPLYRSWRSMKYRCLNPNAINYADYGGRGITVCDRWMDAKLFAEDMLPTWQSGLSLDRIDVNGNYEPSNCRWLSSSANSKNKRQKAEFQSEMDHVVWVKSEGKWLYRRAFDSKEEAERFAKENE